MTVKQALKEYFDITTNLQNTLKCGKFNENKLGEEEYLYHYTNDDGLYGILKSGEFWFTETSALNDPSEEIYLRDSLIEALRTTPLPNPRTAQLINEIQSNYSNFLSTEFKSYALCFSLHQNDLTQWRSYADDGHGYALRFKKRELLKAFYINKFEPNKSFSSFSMIYDPARLSCAINQVSSALKATLDKIDALHESDQKKDSYVDVLALNSAIFISIIGTYFKHPCYDSEREVRFRIELTERDLERKKGNKFVEYTKLNWRKSALDSLDQIMIGPAASELESRKLVQSCLSYFGYKQKIAITRSDLPYVSERRIR